MHPTYPDSSGIEGVALRSPARPGPQRSDQPNEAPIEATFHVLDSSGEEIATFETDAEGRFKVNLPPGDYTIVPGDNAPVIRPSRQGKPVSVGAEAFTQLRLVFDSGMR